MGSACRARYHPACTEPARQFGPVRVCARGASRALSVARRPGRRERGWRRPGSLGRGRRWFGPSGGGRPREQVSDAPSTQAGLLLPALPRQLDGIAIVLVPIQGLVGEHPGVLTEETREASALRTEPVRVLGAMAAPPCAKGTDVGDRHRRSRVRERATARLPEIPGPADGRHWCMATCSEASTRVQGRAKPVRPRLRPGCSSRGRGSRSPGEPPRCVRTGRSSPPREFTSQLPARRGKHGRCCPAATAPLLSTAPARIPSYARRPPEPDPTRCRESL